MKKLLMSAICLSLFAISISLIQISCSKTEAQTSTNQISSINKIIFQEESTGGAGNPNVVKFFIMNFDGTGVQQINISFPAGFSVASMHPPVLSPDGSKVFFTGRETAYTVQGIYSCDISGSNVIRIHDCNATAFDAIIGGAY